MAGQASLEHYAPATWDGCAKAGASDKNGWIKDCNTQAPIYPDYLEIIAKLREMMQHLAPPFC